MAALKTKTVSVNDLHANPWNPNQQAPRVQAAVRESVATFGFIDPVTVRPHPDLDGQYQVIDGEHRWIAARELGIKDVAVVVLDLPDAAAKKLTIVLNETRGTADTVDLAYLLKEIDAELGDGDAPLGEALPYTEGELQALLDMAVDGWTPTDPPEPDPGEEGWQTVKLRMPEQAALAWRGAVDAFYETHPLPEGGGDDVAAGLAAEAFAAEWMAGTRE